MYWNFVFSETGLILAAATAFRSLFVTRAARAARRDHHRMHERYWEKRKGLSPRIFAGKFTSSEATSGELPRVGHKPGLTGLRTLFSGWGETRSPQTTVVGDEESLWKQKILVAPEPVAVIGVEAPDDKSEGMTERSYDVSKPLPRLPESVRTSTQASQTATSTKVSHSDRY